MKTSPAPKSDYRQTETSPLSTSFGMVAKTLQGLEQVLAGELEAIGAKDISTGPRAVYFSGDNEVLYKANLWCRTALRILKPISTFTAEDDKALYEEIKKIVWEKLLSVSDTLAIDAVVSNSAITHSKYAALKAKDAVVDRFRDLYQSRPSVDVESPTLRIHLHISKNRCAVSLDSSGSSLHVRGYRKFQGDAPVNEVLAAGLIALSGWDAKSNFVDFMCGSGTLLIEAALKALNIAPGIFRKEFGFQRWKYFDEALWSKILREARRGELRQLPFAISGCDESLRAIAGAEENIRRAGVADHVRLAACTLEEFTPPAGPGMAVVNPPYGERIQPDKLNELYKAVGDTLKKKYAGYSAWILTSNLDAAKCIGLRPSRKIALLNGPLECKFMRFDMYKGSKKSLYGQGPEQE